jgi:hypothetical protein
VIAGVASRRSFVVIEALVTADAGGEWRYRVIDTTDRVPSIVRRAVERLCISVRGAVPRDR